MEEKNSSNEIAPNNYLVWSIVSIVLCWPFGIPAIVNAAKVGKYWSAGQFDLAHEASQKARKWSLISTIFAGVFWALYFLYVVILAVIIAGDFY